MTTLSPPRSPQASRVAALIVPLLVLSACGGAAMASPTPASSAVATAIVAPNPTAGLLPTSSPITPAAQTALAAYARAITAKDVSFHLEQQDTIRIDGIVAEIDSSVLDVSGGDVAASINTAAESAEIVSIDDRMWIRLDADWREVEPDESVTSEIVDIFGYGGDPADLVYISSAPGRGGSVHRFRIAAPLPYQTSAMKDDGLVGSVSAYEITIDDSGAPVTIEMTTTSETSPTGERHIAETMSAIQITRFADKIEIKAPD